jgi:CTP:molybdopterin cytidylyltransferase MocA
MNNTGIIILAAGASSRFGTPKQLTHFNGKTFLQHVIDEAINADPASIVVVTGANTEEVSSSIGGSNVRIIFNKDWTKGMATGIVTGVHAIRQLDKMIERIIIAVCDQPFVSSALFNQLDKVQQESRKPIVASGYANTIGTPVLFTRRYFDNLLNLSGDTGARQLLKEHKEDVITVDFPKGAVDIDTKEDLDKLCNEQSAL